MIQAGRNALQFLDLELETRFWLASLSPARVLGLDDRKGRIAAGYDADLVLLDEDWRSGEPGSREDRFFG